MEKEKMKEQLQTPHVVAVPLSAQGHINAMIDLSISLASRGVLVTVLLIKRLCKSIFSNPQEQIRVSEELKHKHGLLLNFMEFEEPQGMPAPGQQVDTRVYSQVFRALQSQDMVAYMIRVVEQLKMKKQSPPVTCIISDCFLSATYEVCQALNLPRVIFWPYPAAIAVTQINTELLISQGHIPVKAQELKNPIRKITCLPGIPELVPKDIRSFFREEYSDDPIFDLQIHLSKMQDKADWALINTFDDLEGPQTMAAISGDHGYPAQAIGPICLENFLKFPNQNNSPLSLIRANRGQENSECLEWLDNHSPNSVLFVSFGSVALMSAKQLIEIALGLKESKQPFLWVIRPDCIRGGSAVVSDEYLKEIEGRGLVISWAPQLKVLSHPSVGGFLTHNGWNSTIESISMGVPMIGWPYWSDQFLNCRFSQDVWHIGIDLEGQADENGFVTSVKIKETVTRLMHHDSEEGKKLRKKASELKDAAIKAVRPGGSSHRNLDAFVHHLRQLCSKK